MIEKVRYESRTKNKEEAEEEECGADSEMWPIMFWSRV